MRAGCEARCQYFRHLLWLLLGLMKHHTPLTLGHTALVFRQQNSQEECFSMKVRSFTGRHDQWMIIKWLWTLKWLLSLPIRWNGLRVMRSIGVKNGNMKDDFSRNWCDVIRNVLKIWAHCSCNVLLVTFFAHRKLNQQVWAGIFTSPRA